MSEHASAFVQHLQTLQEKKDLGALATLRRSLAFEPGSYPRAFPYVERFVGEAHERDARRLALYVVAGLFATHPEPNAQSFATAFGRLARQRKVSTEREYSLSIERRFIALLEADADGIHIHLRHAISLLKAEGLGLDYAALLDDLSWWMNPNSNLDRVRQRWARDFYRATQAKGNAEQALNLINQSRVIASCGIQGVQALVFWAFWAAACALALSSTHFGRTHAIKRSRAR